MYLIVKPPTIQINEINCLNSNQLVTAIAPINSQTKKKLEMSTMRVRSLANFQDKNKFLFLGLIKSFRNILPVYYIPPGRYVVWSFILVL